MARKQVQTENQGIPLPEVNEEQGQALGRAFWSLVKCYSLTRQEQAILLGLKPKPSYRGTLHNWEENQSVPENMDVFNRVGILLGIHKNLRILYPYNRELVYSFLKTPWSLLSEQSPMEFIAADPIHSLNRLFTVRRILDQIRVGY